MSARAKAPTRAAHACAVAGCETIRGLNNDDDCLVVPEELGNRCWRMSEQLKAALEVSIAIERASK